MCVLVSSHEYVGFCCFLFLLDRMIIKCSIVYYYFYGGRLLTFLSRSFVGVKRPNCSGVVSKGAINLVTTKDLLQLFQIKTPFFIKSQALSLIRKFLGLKKTA